MQPVPRIFVSATSRDLKTARGLVSEGLRRMECLPIVQDDFPPDYKSVREMLRTKLETCDAVVHLAGFYYGAEPQPVLDGPDRRSFTQMEYEIAVELGLPCYVFLCGEKFPFDEHEPEPEEKRALQLAHRGRLLERDELYYEFESREELSSRTRELQLSVEGLRDELAKERSRRRLTLVVSAVALLVAVAGGIFLFSKSQSQEAVIAETTEKLDEQGELIAKLLAEQERLRAAQVAPGEIAERAEANVAKAMGRTPEEVREAVEAEIGAAQEELMQARASGNRGRKMAALLRVAEAQKAGGHTTEAIAAFRERRALMVRDERPVEWAEATRELADSLFWQDFSPTEPKEILAEAVEWARGEDELGPNHPATLTMMMSLSRVVPPAESVELLGHVLAERDRRLGPDHPMSQEAAIALGAQRMISGEFAEADELFERVIAARTRLDGASDPGTFRARSALATSMELQERFDESEEIYRDLVKLSSAAVGAGNVDTLSYQIFLASTLEKRGDQDEAIQIYRDGVAASVQTNGENGEFTLDLEGSLAVRLIQAGELQEAEAVARRAVDGSVATIGENQARTIQALGTLASALEEQGKTDEYAAVMERRRAAQVAVYGPDDSRVGE